MFICKYDQIIVKITLALAIFIGYFAFKVYLSRLCPHVTLVTALHALHT